MHSALEILVVSVVLANATELVASNGGDPQLSDTMHKLVDKSFDNLFDRALKALLLHHAELDSTTLRKPSHLALNSPGHLTITPRTLLPLSTHRKIQTKAVPGKPSHPMISFRMSMRPPLQLDHKREVRARAELPKSPDLKKSLERTAELDSLINLLVARMDDESSFARAVSDNVLGMDQAFWLRIATRVDTAKDSKEKDRLADMSSMAMRVTEAVVTKAQEGMDDKVQVLQEILSAAADKNGNWFMPLSPTEYDAMKEAMAKNVKELDETFLSTVYAWLRKASQDSKGDMASLLQTVLQIWAAGEVTSEDVEGDSGRVNNFLKAQAEEWDALAAKLADEGNEANLKVELQRRMEKLVGLPSGSNAQRVQAEYLKEASDRIDAAFRKKDQASTQKPKEQ